MDHLSTLPYVTEDLPGTGGLLRRQTADFFVAEIPAYAPTGAGSHVFVRIEKIGIETRAAIAALARSLDVAERDVGCAGQKDRHAVTEQVLSFPPPVTVERVLGVAVDGIRILSADYHPHKLKTGHLSGNRFRVVVRHLKDSAAVACERARRVLERLAAPPGCPNWYGRQRFGRDNAEKGRELLAAPGRARGRSKRFVISAYQSLLFNRYLDRRIRAGTLGTALAGDVLQKVESGGLFVCEHPDIDQVRIDRGEIVVTGPMFGHKMKAPAADSPSAALEQELLAAEGISPESFRSLGKLALGTRRALSIRIGEPNARVVDGEALEVTFSLPSGSYATAVMREVLKGAESFPD
jgi:tRNA pseudouridine13 synthase